MMCIVQATGASLRISAVGGGGGVKDRLQRVDKVIGNTLANTEQE